MKPQVLTHVIEDFVIQESSEPFPVRPGLLADYKNAHSGDKDCDEPPRKLYLCYKLYWRLIVAIFLGKRHAGFTPSNVVGMSPKGELAKCDACGTVDLRAKFKKNKRFCSIMCSKKYDSKKNFSVAAFNL